MESTLITCFSLRSLFLFTRIFIVFFISSISFSLVALLLNYHAAKRFPFKSAGPFRFCVCTEDLVKRERGMGRKERKGHNKATNQWHNFHSSSALLWVEHKKSPQALWYVIALRLSQTKGFLEIVVTQRRLFGHFIYIQLLKIYFWSPTTWWLSCLNQICVFKSKCWSLQAMWKKLLAF